MTFLMVQSDLKYFDFEFLSGPTYTKEPDLDMVV